VSRRAADRVLRGLLLALVLAAIAGLIGLWQVGIGGPGLERLTLTVRGHEVDLLDPAQLLLLALVPLLWLAPLYSLGDLPRLQRLLTMLLRTLGLALLVLALSRPAVSGHREQVAAVVLADVSDSVPEEALRQEQAFVDEIYRAAGDAPVHLVSFAAEPVELQPAPPGPPDSPAPGPRPAPRLARHPQGQATDLDTALKMAYGLFPPDHLRRVVILSDGHQTVGDLLAESLNAARFGVRVSYRTFDVPPPPEVLIADLGLPETIEVDTPFSLRAAVHSTTETKVTLDLWQDDYREGAPLVTELKPGLNTVDLPATVREPGYRQFRLELTPAPATDRLPGNNTFTQVAVVKGKPRVLLLEGDPQQARFLAGALRAQGIDVEVRGPQGMPSSLPELESFDLLLFSDVPATFLTTGQMELIGAYLRELGGGFLMAGGENSLGLGGYFQTPIEELLPVRLDVEKKRETPSLAMLLIIDRSGSMADEKIDLAKEAARAVVELLGPDDNVGVVAFDSQPETLVRLQPARNRLRILGLVARLRGGGGTAILPALQAAYDQLVTTDAQIRHGILLSDGESPREGILELVGEMAAEGITLSAVAVGQEADRALLSAIAESGGGRYHYAASMREVPRFFTKETQTVSRNILVEEPFHPRSEKRFQILKGIPLEQAPYLYGYVATRAKKGAEILLTSEKGEPLLARWKVGLGTSMVWTSDIKNRWSVDWVRWRHYPKFWAQLVRDTMRTRKDLGFELAARVVEGRATVQLDAIDKHDRFVNGMRTVVQIDGPDRYHEELQLDQTAAGRYEGHVSLPEFGSYLLEALHLVEGRQVGATLGGLANPYPRELLNHGVNHELLSQAARLTGGQEEITPGQIFDPQGEQVVYHRELRREVILLALALFLVDLLLRRVRLGRARELPFP